MSDQRRFRRTAPSRDSEQGADTRPEPGTFETIGASFQAARADTTGYDEEQKSEAYGEVITALADLGYSVDRYVSPSRGSTGIAYDRVYRDAMREKARGRFKDLPDTQAAFEKKWRADVAARIAQAEDTAGRGGGIARFAGGVAGTMTDPVNLMTLPIGGVGKSVATRVITEGLANMAIEAASQPIVNAQRREFGRRELTTEESLTNIAMAGVGSAVIRGGIEIAPAAGRALGKIDAKAAEIAAPVRAKVDKVFAERDLAREFSRQVPLLERTPEQRAALHVIGRAEEVEAVNPFANTYDGIDAHTAKLNAAMDAIEIGRIATPAPRSAPGAVSPAARPRVASPGESTGGKLHGGIVGYLQRAGLTPGQARGIAAGIEAESGSNPRISNPTSGAFGIGQWLGSRKRLLVKRYGPNPSMEQQLEFLVWELRGGDHGGRKVLSQGDEAAVLRSYISDFMRPAAGAETSGDMSRGMAALGRGSEDVPVERAAGGGDGDAEMLAALSAEEADIAGARGRSDGAMADLFDEGGAPRAAGDAPVPELRRDLFPDETSWRIAQAAAEAEGSGHAPIVTRQSVWDDARGTIESGGTREVAGALFHPEVGPIAVKGGNGKDGLARIAGDRAELLDQLPEILADMEIDIARSNASQMVLTSPDGQATITLKRNAKADRWELSAVDHGADVIAPGGGSRRGSNKTAKGGLSDTESKMTPGQLLSSYWERARDPEPFWVARGENGTVKGWSANKGELEARAGGEGVTIAREGGPDGGGEVSPALAKQMDLFDDHAGPGARMVAESDWHDVRASEAMRAMTIDIGDGSGARSVAEIEAELDIADAGLAAMRECMA